jgi:hypothetical protein
MALKDDDEAHRAAASVGISLFRAWMVSENLLRQDMTLYIIFLS